MTKDHHFKNTVSKIPPEAYAPLTGAYGRNYSFVFSDDVRDWYTSKTNTRQADYKKKLKHKSGLSPLGETEEGALR